VIRGDHLSKAFSADSGTFADVAYMPIKANVDRIVVAVYNTDTSASTEKITFRVLVQLVPNGSYIEYGVFSAAAGFSPVPVPLAKGVAFLGFIEDIGIEAVKVEVLRSGSGAIPGLVELKCLRDGFDS